MHLLILSYNQWFEKQKCVRPKHAAWDPFVDGCSNETLWVINAILRYLLRQDNDVQQHVSQKRRATGCRPSQGLHDSIKAYTNASICISINHQAVRCSFMSTAITSKYLLQVILRFNRSLSNLPRGSRYKSFENCLREKRLRDCTNNGILSFVKPNFIISRQTHYETFT